MQRSGLWTLGPAYLPVPSDPPYFNHRTGDGGRAGPASGQDLLQEERELRWAFSVDPLEPPAVSDQLAGVGPWLSGVAALD